MDGTRMVARFNPGTHTIRDVRRFLDLSRPGGFGGAGYHLVTAFPTTVLSEEDKTIEELGLKKRRHPSKGALSSILVLKKKSPEMSTKAS